MVVEGAVVWTIVSSRRDGRACVLRIYGSPRTKCKMTLSTIRNRRMRTVHEIDGMKDSEVSRLEIGDACIETKMEDTFGLWYQSYTHICTEYNSCLLFTAHDQDLRFLHRQQERDGG